MSSRNVWRCQFLGSLLLDELVTARIALAAGVIIARVALIVLKPRSRAGTDSKPS